MRRNFSILLTAIFLAACATTPLAPPPDWAAWQAKRNESIGGTNGWTTLVGLRWLKEGANQIPENIGVFTRTGTNVAFTAAAGADIRVNGISIQQTNMISDVVTNPTRLQIGPISIVAIQRGERLGLRVRDPNSERRTHFTGLKWFPYNPKLRVEGRFEPFATPRKMFVNDVTGAVQELVSPGAVVFKAGGNRCRLDVVEEPDEEEYFLLFRDKTTGHETYPAGRFLYFARPGADQRVTIDFNHAFTPPCGFTDFATCPIPPPQNSLRIRIDAGELNPHHAAH